MASRTASCRSSLGRSTSSSEASAPLGRAIFSVSGKRAGRLITGTYRNRQGRATGLTDASGNGMVRALRLRKQTATIRCADRGRCGRKVLLRRRLQLPRSYLPPVRETEAMARDGLRVAADGSPAHRAPLWRAWHHQSPPDAPLRFDPKAVRRQLPPQPPDRHRGVVPHAVDEPLPMHGLRRLQQCPKNSLIRMCEPRHTGFTAKLAPLHVEEHGADPHAATVARSARRRASISRQWVAAIVAADATLRPLAGIAATQGSR